MAGSNRFELSEVLIVGGVGGIMGGVLALAIRLGATADNLLNFFGGAVGSGLAVISTLWLERRRRQRALEYMLNSMVIVADSSLRFASLNDELIVPMVLTFQQSYEAFEASRLAAVIEDPLHQYGFHSATFWLKRSMDEMKDAISKHEADIISITEMNTACRRAASHVVGPIQDFLKMDGLPKAPKNALTYSIAARELDRLQTEAVVARSGPAAIDPNVI